MNMATIPTIPGADHLINLFGYWPTFHDAEVKWLRLDRGDVSSGAGPVLEMAVHCFEMTRDITPSGRYALRKHTLAHFRFHEVMDVHLENFNRQNAISGLDIVPESNPDWEHPYFQVTIQGGYGVSGSFHAVSAEVVSAVPCDAKGEAVSF